MKEIKLKYYFPFWEISWKKYDVVPYKKLVFFIIIPIYYSDNCI